MKELGNSEHKCEDISCNEQFYFHQKLGQLYTMSKIYQGSKLTLNRWPQASKNSQNQLRASKIRPQLVLMGQQRFGDILFDWFPLKNVPKVKETSRTSRSQVLLVLRLTVFYNIIFVILPGMVHRSSLVTHICRTPSFSSSSPSHSRRVCDVEQRAYRYPFQLL